MKNITVTQEKLAIHLYQTNQSSAQYIANKLNLSLSQIYRTLKRFNVKRRTPSEQNKINFLNSPTSFKIAKKLTKQEGLLAAAALMLYRGEGAKTGSTVDLANSDPGVLQLFISFLRRVCQIEENRLKLYLYCFSNQDLKSLITFWSKTLKVPVSSFTKPHVRKARADLTRTMPYGVLHIRYSDKRLLEKILTWSEELIQLFHKYEGR